VAMNLALIRGDIQLMDCDVEDIAEDQGVMGQNRDSHQMAEPVFERAGQIVIDLDKTQGQPPPLARLQRTSGAGVRNGIPPDFLDGGRLQGFARHLGDVKGLENERADPLPAAPAVIAAPRHIEDLLRPGHGDVKKPSFLLEGVFRVGDALFEDFVRHRNPFPSPPAWEAVLDQTDHEDHVEFESLGFVDGEDGDRIRIRIEVRRRRVVPGVDERLEVPGNEDRPIVGEEAGLRPDDLEEAGHIAQGFVTAVRGCCGESSGGVPRSCG